MQHHSKQAAISFPKACIVCRGGPRVLSSRLGCGGTGATSTTGGITGRGARARAAEVIATGDEAWTSCSSCGGSGGHSCCLSSHSTCTLCAAGAFSGALRVERGAAIARDGASTIQRASLTGDGSSPSKTVAKTRSALSRRTFGNLKALHAQQDTNWRGKYHERYFPLAPRQG
jgi:hypothetical protein